jgi:hypothetical protein
MEKFGIILLVGKIDSFMIRRGRENLPKVCLWGAMELLSCLLEEDNSYGN